MGDNLKKLDPEQFEREQRLLFEYGEIERTAVNSGSRYGTLTKQLNPGDPTPSVATEFLNFLAGCHETRPELEEAVWTLVCKYRRRMLRQETATPNGVDASYFDLKATVARFEDGVATAEEVESAKARHAAATDGLTVYKPISHERNLG